MYRRVETLNVIDAFPGIKFAVLDVDGYFIDAEQAQEESWVEVTLRDAFSRAKPGGARNLLERDLRHHFKHIFETGEYARFMGGLFDLYQEHDLLIEGMEVPNDLDDYLSAMREPDLIKRAEEGRIVMSQGALTFLLGMKAKGVTLGYYTNTPSRLNGKIVEAVLHGVGYSADYFFGAEHRLYGDQVAVKKPHRGGWRLLAERMGADFSQTIVGDDHPLTLQSATYRVKKEEGEIPFLGGLGLVSPQREQRWHEVFQGGDDNGVTVYGVATLEDVSF